MTIPEAIAKRHSVRAYTDRRIDEETADALRAEIEACNAEGALHLQLLLDEPEAFHGAMAHYGKISGVRNYVALVGKKRPGISEAIGYYGERVALKAQVLGLNTCWVALTFSRRKAKHVLDAGEKLICVLALGHGATQGIAHKSKPMEELCKAESGNSLPDWFRAGMEAAMLAPTAVNQQKFLLTLRENGTVSAEATGGFYDKVDLGIVKYHFEQGAGKDSFRWA